VIDLTISVTADTLRDELCQTPDPSLLHQTFSTHFLDPLPDPLSSTTLPDPTEPLLTRVLSCTYVDLYALRAYCS